MGLFSVHEGHFSFIKPRKKTESLKELIQCIYYTGYYTPAG